MTPPELFAIVQNAVENHKPALDIKGPLLPPTVEHPPCMRSMYRSVASVSEQEVRNLVESLLQADELRGAIVLHEPITHYDINGGPIIHDWVSGDLAFRVVTGFEHSRLSDFIHVGCWVSKA